MTNNNYKKIADKLLGYTKTDFEKIFEDVILPIYTFQCTTPNSKPNYKIEKRVEEKELDMDKIRKVISELGIIPLGINYEKS